MRVYVEHLEPMKRKVVASIVPIQTASFATFHYSYSLRSPAELAFAIQQGLVQWATLFRVVGLVFARAIVVGMGLILLSTWPFNGLAIILSLFLP